MSLKNKKKTNNCGLHSVILLQALTILCLFSCSSEKSKVDKDSVAEVISSMSDSLPVVSLPEGADPEHEDWKGADLGPKAPVLPLYPEEEAKKFLLPEGYHIEPILTEPQIQQPGAISFDGNGRMFVLELRTYMLTADSDGTLEPTSRISRWEDADNDGVYETGTVFVDSLIFPRFVLPYGKDAVLTMNSDEDNVYKFTDTDGDGKADKKELFTTNYGRSGNVEHQQAFMYYNMDNWLYSTYNAFRVRETPTGVIRENTGYNRAQWGVTHDDDGKVWFLGGASGLPSQFQQPVHYGNFDYEDNDNYAEGFEEPWGAPVLIGDLQEGMDRVRENNGGPKRVTGAAGNDIYRGDRLPKELYGQLFYGEPVARIVRQVNPVVNEGITTLHNVFQDQKSEFLRSTDPLFRPVDMTTAPDGTMYITDMYHGIIQEGNWTQKGTYLRTKIEQYQLDKVIGLGRIWRITHASKERDKTKPNMLNETPAQLVKHLEHPNGWWRDMAQQLIVLSQDRSIVPELEAMVNNNDNTLARFHALWCLEGLGSLKEKMVKKLMDDPNPRMRIQAMRAGETLYKSGKKSLGEDYLKLLEDKIVDVALQAVLSAHILEVPSFDAALKKLLKSNLAKGIQTIGTQILEPKEVKNWWEVGNNQLTDAQKNSLEKGKVIFNELCVQCHGNDGTGTPVGDGLVMAPALSGSTRVQSHPEYVIKTVMHGLEGPLDGKTYPAGIMVGNKEQSDDWIASIVSYIRTNLSNEATLVSAEDVHSVRTKTEDRKAPYVYDELMTSVPQLLVPNEDWNITASHSVPTRIGGRASPTSAFNFEGWSTGGNQEEGMWFQIEFPEPMSVSEIHFNATPISRGWRPGSPPPLHTFPRGYRLETSMDGSSWKEIEKGEGEQADVSLIFDPDEAKFIRMSLTKNFGPQEDREIPWSMRQMKIYGASKKPVL
ncbi:sorbosone dehydrogenase [Maribacter algicola]|uniref:Sorbosone dehydrogenase n=1 Tax=Maribacter algicola TaxID=2498892 RepID=A0A3R8R2Y8_9FLAO|nr:sorbosone dehydrogenase [Maribacter algicola]